MRRIEFNGHILELYDDVEDMPIINFQKYNKYLLIDSGIGSDADSIDAHIVKVAKLIKANDHEKALQELNNMRHNMYMVNCEISPMHMAFAALIKSVDGKDVTDLSDSGLTALLGRIRTIKRHVILDFMSGLKKKIADTLVVYFPGDFTVGAKSKALYAKLKERASVMLDCIIDGSDNSAAINDIDAEIFSMYRPDVFTGPGSVEVCFDKSFEMACLLISQKTNADARKMTVLQFYSALDIIKKQTDVN